MEALSGGLGVAPERLEGLGEDPRHCFAQDAMDQVAGSGRRLLAAVEEGNALRTYLAALKRFSKRKVANTVALRRQVADAAIEAGGYPFA